MLPCLCFALQTVRRLETAVKSRKQVAAAVGQKPDLLPLLIVQRLQHFPWQLSQLHMVWALQGCRGQPLALHAAEGLPVKGADGRQLGPLRDAWEAEPAARSGELVLSCNDSHGVWQL